MVVDTIYGAFHKIALYVYNPIQLNDLLLFYYSVNKLNGQASNNHMRTVASAKHKPAYLVDRYILNRLNLSITSSNKDYRE